MISVCVEVVTSTLVNTMVVRPRDANWNAAKKSNAAIDVTKNATKVATNDATIFDD